ncbi:hypothetical protein T4B_8185 [Trichinella pseudospiralis]|uniref:Uncharacterized protein n=1 Tax=Trichinella pseudospiralis TaxID=6337 RepID=A0A0V1E2L5_TRIPS|nr:hypothetical protein T4A_3304 [Trichinella pseudospiralis]KRZ04257.1 hypothetical protein T4B_8185 [Trichinella pseudospiralis]KRZ24812.1 hypothetical protein T4C_1016 [Trichinella pseudospiralis]
MVPRVEVLRWSKLLIGKTLQMDINHVCHFMLHVYFSLKKKSKARRKRNYLTVDKSEASSSVFEIARGLRKKALKSVSLKTVETVSTKTLSSKQEAKK